MVESARRQGDAYQLRGAGPVMRAIADEMRIMSRAGQRRGQAPNTMRACDRCSTPCPPRRTIA